MSEAKQLLDAAGNPVAVADLDADAQQVVAVTQTDVVPAMVHGFAVRHFMGPYPIDARQSHRKAIYVELWPVDAQAVDLCKKLGSERVHAFTPLTPDGVAEIEADPQGGTAELVVLDTLRAAVRAVRKYLVVPRQSFEQRRS